MDDINAIRNALLLINNGIRDQGYYSYLVSSGQNRGFVFEHPNQKQIIPTHGENSDEFLPYPHCLTSCKYGKLCMDQRNQCQYTSKRNNLQRELAYRKTKKDEIYAHC